MKNRSLFVSMLAIAAVCVPGLNAFEEVPRKDEKSRSPEAASPSVDANGDPLPYPAVARFGTVRLRHGQWVRSVAFSPEGKELASSSFDGTIRYWDPKTGKELRRFPKLLNTPERIAYVNDGKELLVVEGAWRDRPGEDVFCGIRTWDVATGKPVRTIREGINKGFRFVERVGISPRGDRIALGNSQTISVFDPVIPGKPVVVRMGDVRAFTHLAFSADGQRLSVGALLYQEGDADRDKRPSVVRVCALPTGKILWERKGITSSASGVFPAADFSPDGKKLAVSFSYSEQMLLLDAETGETIRQFAGKTIGYWPFRFTADSARLFVNGSGIDDEIWDVATGNVLRPWSRHGFDSFELALSPDGKTMASAESRRVRLMNAETGESAIADTGLSETIDHIELAPDGRRLLAGGYRVETGFSIWDRHTSRKLFDYPRAATSFSLSPDGKTVAVGSTRNSPPETFHLELMKVVGGPAKKGTQARWLSYAPDASRIIHFGWFENQIREFEPATMASRLLLEVPNDKQLAAVAFFPKGDRIVVGLDGRHFGPEPTPAFVEIWDVAQKQKVRSLTGLLGNTPLVVAVSPNGRRVAAASAEARYVWVGGPADTRVVVWDADTGEQILALTGSVDGHRCLAFSPDGRTIAAGGEDHNVYLWESATGTLRAKYVCHEGPVTAVKFAADSRTLYTGSSDTTVLAWNVIAPPIPGVEVATAWADLATGDGLKAYRAMCSLIAAPADTIAMLRQRLKKAPTPPSEDTIRRLIADLGSPKFGTRETASNELLRIGRPSLPLLRVAARDQSLEVSRRAEGLIKVLDPYPLTGRTLEELRSLEILEHIATPEARQLLVGLSEGGQGHLLTEEAKSILKRWKVK